MKRLKVILGIIYPILIILLLLSNCRGCKDNNEATQEPIEVPNDTTITEPRDNTEPIDTIVRQAQETGQSGNLKITLLWDFQADIDLHVIQPNGKKIYYKEREDSSTGGFLDVDNRTGGNGSAENIFWDNPPKGTYTVSLVYFHASTSTNIAESGICSVVIFQEGKSPQKYQVEMHTVKESKEVVKINIQ